MNIIIWSSVSILCFILCSYLAKRIKISIFNPVLISIILLMGIVVINNIDYEVYKKSTNWITFILGPIVVMLAVPLYKSRLELKKNLIPIMSGVISSVIISVGSVWVLCKMFGLDEAIIKSMLSKSITTPMAIEVTNMVGGIPGITIGFVVVTGIIGATIAKWVIKVFNVKNEIAKGIGIGTSSHGVGTAKAIEISSEVAAASSLAMGISGVITVITFSIISSFLK